MKFKFVPISNPFFWLKIKWLKIKTLKSYSKKGFLIVKLRFVFLPTAFIVYGILVHYRVGSLETFSSISTFSNIVHYRVGSLENRLIAQNIIAKVHYRVGSLEILHHSKR